MIDASFKRHHSHCKSRTKKASSDFNDFPQSLRGGADASGIKPPPVSTGPGKCAVAKPTILKKEAARKSTRPVRSFYETPYASGFPVKPIILGKIIGFGLNDFNDCLR
jgi:hypothetical protein